MNIANIIKIYANIYTYLYVTRMAKKYKIKKLFN